MAVVKKTVAKKVTGNSLAAAKPVDDDASIDDVGKYIVKMVEDGELDVVFSELVTAIENRETVMEEIFAKEEAAAKKTAAPKAVTAAPKLPATPPMKKRVATVTPVAGVQYKIVDNFPKVGNALVTFVRFHKNGKAVVKLVDGVAGHPEGAQVAVDVAALKEAPAAKKRARATAVTPAKTPRKVATTTGKKVVRRAAR